MLTEKQMKNEYIDSDDLVDLEDGYIEQWVGIEWAQSCSSNVLDLTTSLFAMMSTFHHIVEDSILMNMKILFRLVYHKRSWLDEEFRLFLRDKKLFIVTTSDLY